MNRTAKFPAFLALIALAALGAALAAGPAGAQASTARIDGLVLDPWKGEPWPDITVTAKHDMGLTQTQKTDAKGRFAMAGLRSGNYSLTFQRMEGPELKQFYEITLRLSTGQEERLTFDFKKMMAGQQEEMKKQQEAAAKFEGMKANFDQGRMAMDQAREFSAQASKAPADQKATLNQQAAASRAQAIGYFQQAQQAADPKEEQLHLIFANLGLAFEADAKYAEAEAAYARALELKPTQTNYIVGLGNVQARQGKVADAMASCDKVAALDPTNSAMCFRNLGIVLYNANKLKDAIDPLKKATTLDPANPEQWYLLGASLLAIMDSKKEGDKMIYIFAPGTGEAYAKYLELAPTGRFAGEAQGALQMMESLGAGVPTKLRVAKKKN
jgi:tetratricopeptide (TPR) repeat protein